MDTTENTVVESTITEPKEVVQKKKNKETEERRQGIVQLVETKLQELKKPITHTDLFFEIFGKDVEQSKKTDEQWRDIGRALQGFVNNGKAVSKIPEGKKRMVFSWMHEEVKEETTAPESTNTEGEGI